MGRTRGPGQEDGRGERRRSLKYCPCACRGGRTRADSGGSSLTVQPLLNPHTALHRAPRSTPRVVEASWGRQGGDTRDLPLPHAPLWVFGRPWGAPKNQARPSGWDSWGTRGRPSIPRPLQSGPGMGSSRDRRESGLESGFQRETPPPISALGVQGALGRRQTDLREGVSY